MATGHRDIRKKATSWMSLVLPFLVVGCGEVMPRQTDPALGAEEPRRLGSAVSSETRVPMEQSAWPFDWHVSPLNVSGWRAVELIQEYYPEILRADGREEQLVYTVCVDASGGITHIGHVSPAHADPGVVAAGHNVLQGSRFLPAWRYVGSSRTRVEPVAGCRGQSVYFYEGQLTKSRHQDTSLGLQLILDGQLVRVWDDGLVVAVDTSRKALSEAELIDMSVWRLDPSRIVNMYKLNAPDVRRQFGLEVRQPIFVLETQ